MRRCDACAQKVTLCNTQEEAVREARRGHCIAVPRALMQQATQETSTHHVVGRPHLPGYWAQRLFPDAK